VPNTENLAPLARVPEAEGSWVHSELALIELLRPSPWRAGIFLRVTTKSPHPAPHNEPAPGTDMRRTGALTPGMMQIAVTLQGSDGLPISAEVAIARIRMPCGGLFLQFICGSCGRRAQVLRLHGGRIQCRRCTGLRYWCEGKPAVRRAQHRIERLKATRFHGGPVSRRPGRTMERRAQLTASLRRSEAVVRRHRAGRILAALKADMG
jgi:hypothetical protein